MINQLKMKMNLICGNEIFQLLLMVLLVSLMMVLADAYYTGF